jgi:hypothetical protein
MSSGAFPPAAAQFSKYHVSHNRGLIFQWDSVAILCAVANMTLIWRDCGRFGNYWHRLHVGKEGGAIIREDATDGLAN